MVRKLSELGLLEHEPYRGVRLTSQGRRALLDYVEHLERLLPSSAAMKGRAR